MDVEKENSKILTRKKNEGGEQMKGMQDEKV